MIVSEKQKSKIQPTILFLSIYVGSIQYPLSEKKL